MGKNTHVIGLKPIRENPGKRSISFTFKSSSPNKRQIFKVVNKSAPKKFYIGIVLSWFLYSSEKLALKLLTPWFITCQSNIAQNPLLPLCENG